MARIAFIQQIPYPLLGVMYLASIAKKHKFQTEVFITTLEKDVVEKVCDYSPNIVCFSCSTDEYFHFLDLAKSIKEKIDVTVIFGGSHTTFKPEIINEEPIDIVCRGEGELVMSNFLDAFKSKKGIITIKGLWVKKRKKVYQNSLQPLIKDLDTLPFPDKKIYNKYPVLNELYHTIVGRGCLHRCSYCFNVTYNSMYNYKNIIRKRSAKNVIQELQQCKQKVIRFSDDNFLNDPRWVNKFLKLYKGHINKPFSCLIRFDTVKEEEIKFLKESGCFMVGWGMESGEEDIRKKILKRNMTNAQILNLSMLLLKYRLKFTIYNMCGIPMETEEDMIKTVKWNRMLKPYFTNISIMRVYPGTRIPRTNLLHGNNKKAENISNLFHLFVFLPIPISVIKWVIRIPPNPLFIIMKKVYIAIRFKRTYKLSLSYCMKYFINIILKKRFKMLTRAV